MSTVDIILFDVTIQHGSPIVPVAFRKININPNNNKQKGFHASKTLRRVFLLNSISCPICKRTTFYLVSKLNYHPPYNSM